MGVDDEPAARSVQKADADGSNVVQARDIHGDIHLAVGHDRRVLGLLNPHTEALQVAAMADDDAAKLLAAEPVPVSGRVVAALLTADYNLAVSLLGSINRHRAEELVVAAGPAAVGLEDLPEAAEAITECAARMRFKLGVPSGRLERAGTSAQGTGGFWREFEHGGIHWSTRAGAQATIGPIADYHRDMGGSRRRLGFPLSPAEAVHGSFPETTGLCQRFESSADYGQEICGALGLRFGAAVYWSEMHGAHATGGPIGEFYERAHGPAGWLGFPVSEEAAVGPSARDNGTGTTGLRQRFEGGAVYYSDKTGTIAVPASIAEHHEQQHRGVASPLGFPVSPLLDAKPSPLYNTSGCFQRFEGKWDYSRDILDHWSESEGPGGATIYFSRAHGTHCVGWGNGTLYERMGGTGSWLGFPKSDEVKRRLSSKDRPGYTVQEFEHGVIIYSPEHGSVAVPRATMEYLDQLGGMRELLGLPLRRSPTATADEAAQFFENGVVVIRDGSPEVYLRAVNSAVEAPQPIRLVALRFAPEVVMRGQQLLLEYEIFAVPGSPSLVVLGASLVAADRDDYFDKAGDLQVDVTPGRHSYNRHLRVPAAAPAGTYRLIGAIWHPATGEQRLTSLDRGFVVTVTEATE